MLVLSVGAERMKSDEEEKKKPRKKKKKGKKEKLVTLLILLFFFSFGFSFLLVNFLERRVCVGNTRNHDAILGSRNWNTKLKKKFG